MSNWKPVDVLIIMFGATICISVLVTVIAFLFPIPDYMDDQTEKQLITVMSTMLSIVSLYVGAQFQRAIDRYKNKQNKE